MLCPAILGRTEAGAAVHDILAFAQPSDSSRGLRSAVGFVAP
jgi:hypothetical protein